MTHSHRFLALFSVATLGLAPSFAQSHDAHEKGKVAPTVEELAAYPLKTCLVTDEDLDEMGHPVVYHYKEAGKADRVILLCCKDCVADLEKEPAKYLKKLDEAAAKKAQGKK